MEHYSGYPTVAFQFNDDDRYMLRVSSGVESVTVFVSAEEAREMAKRIAGEVECFS